VLRELVQIVRSGGLSAVVLVERAYERVGSLNGELNAVVALRDAGEALAEAGLLDERARRGERLGPLAGIPFLVKDSQDLAGLRTTHGSLLLAEAAPATRDALSVARLRVAGAIPIGKTNVPEHCFEGFTDNLLFGATHNPWAPKWSPGGSSGGSAAALAAGMVPIATATDGGGSVRIPAGFCGLFGLKPTNGLVGRDPIPPWMDFSTDGPLALSMADLRLLLAIIAGPARGDPGALPTELAALLVGPGAAANASGAPLRRPSLVLAAPRFVEWGPLPNAVADQFDAALTSLEKDLGLPVEPIAPAQILGAGDIGNADEDWLVTCACEQAHAMGRAAIEAGAERFHPAFLAAMRRGLAVSIEDYLAARRRRFAYARALDKLLGADRVLVTPTTPQQGFYADGRESGAKRPGTGVSSYNTQVQNMTGHPALSVPAGRSPNGVPFGLQITGPRFADALVLDIGDAWETAHPGERLAPGFTSFLPAG
jgi:amidase/aspartyl-tRNA(Asn)/glutamyl-tRNA(Gln) amidotransferase subunit A